MVPLTLLKSWCSFDPFALTDNYKIRSKDLYVNVGEPVFVKPEMI